SLFDTEINKTGLSKIDLLKKLTEQYRISGDFDKGISFCSKGLELSKQESQSPEKIIEFHKELGLLNFNKGNYQKAIEILNEGLSLCNKTQDSKAKSDLNIKLGWTYKRKTEYAQAITHFHKVIELSGEVISKELGLALNGLGSVYSDLGELNKAFNLYQKALKIFVELGDENRIATVQMNLGLLVKSMGNPVDALDYFKQSLDFEERYQNVRRLSHLYNNLALTYGNLYDWDKSLEYHQKSYELKEKMEDEAELAITLDNLGIVYLKRGALKNSIEAHSSALRFFRNLKNKRDLAFSCYNLGKVYLLKGEWSKSKIYLEKSLKLREEFNDKIGKAESLCLLGRLNLERGDFPTASAQLKESLRLHDTERNPKKIIEVLLLLTELSLHQNNITEAELHLDYAEKLFKPIEDQALKGELKRIKSLFFIKKDKLEEGIKELLESAGIFRKLKMRYELGLTNLEIGKIKIEEENYKEAKAYLGESLNIFKHMEIPFRIKQCEDLMKGLSDYVQMEKQRTQVLYQITELLRNITDLDELLLKILDLAIKHLNAERAAIILYYPENDSLELKAARGIERETKEDALSISRRVIRNVLEADSPLIIQDARIDPEVSLYKSVITYNILSILCVPLNSKDKTLGTIYVDHRSLCGMFSREDSDFLKAFANLIAVALEKAQYYSHLNEEIFQLKKNLERTYTYPNIIGKSKKMQEVFHMVEKIADTKASVLLLGESGAGKELIANLIHHTSSRKNKSFLKVNCAALPESLLESELFGVEEKVATGVAMRDGKFKQADGGTIFFDEIGDMSLSTQAKVLRVLQEREFERVGGSKTIKVDIRVISATNKDLDDCMKKGTFRKDLFYRLNPVTIKIPPLRERKEDIPYLVEHFLDKFSEENKKPKTLVPVKIMNLLIDYPWPGNVRELANLMEKVVLFSEDGSFSREYLPSKAKSQREKRLLISKRSLSEVLDNVEKEMILSALDNNNWNQVRAALELEISEATLRRKMSKHKIKKQKNNTRQK
ncbi:MAG: sigma 54-interacting transcriptional regulator, partial [candidate division Zixibacteria bacterium]|nr:sigma 54-interacting transcriptional regulator [candidate division Zixibacteria bacterium]